MLVRGYSTFILFTLMASKDILVSSLGGARELTNLHGVLFKNYSKNVRPCLNYSRPTRVNVTMYVATIVGLDIKNQILRLSGYLSFEWVDELLIWNPAQYGDIDSILVPQDWIWRPDVAVYNSVEEHVYIGDDGSLASLSNDGLVRWEPVINLGVTCKVDISKYPFDENICTVNVTAWMSDNDTVQLTINERPVKLENMMTNGEYLVTPYNTSQRFIEYKGKYYVIMGFRLLLKRRPDYLIMTLVLPITMLAVLCVISFLLSPDEPEKVSVSITVLLSFSVFLGIIDNDLPESSDNVSIIVFYVVLLLLLAFLCVAGNAFVVVIHKRDLKRQAPPTVDIYHSVDGEKLESANSTTGDGRLHIPDRRHSLQTTRDPDVKDVDCDDGSVVMKTVRWTRAEKLNLCLLMIPFTMLSLMCVVPFFLAPDEPEKLMVSITLLLSFTVMIDYVSQKLPQTSETMSMLVIYMTTLFIQSFLGVVCNAFVLILNNLDTKRQELSVEKFASPGAVTSLQETGSPWRRWDTWIKSCFLCPNSTYVTGTSNQSCEKEPKEISRAHRLNNYFLVLNIILLVVITTLNWYFMLF